MADQGFVDLLEWALGQDPITFPEGPIRDNARNANVSIWVDQIPDIDKVNYREDIRLMYDALALYEEAQVYLSNQEPNGAQTAWDSTFGPILSQVDETSTTSLNATIGGLDEADVRRLDAYRRVLSAYIIATQAYERTLDQLMVNFTDEFAKNVFDDPIEEEWQAAMAVVGDDTRSTTRMNRLRWIERICAHQQFRARVNTLNRMWVPAVNLGEDIHKANDNLKIWIWLAFDSSGRVVDVS